MARKSPVAVAASVAIALTLLPPIVSAQGAVDDNFAVAAGSTDNELDVLANDELGSGSARIVVVTGPSQGGQASVGPQGQSVIYTPPSGFQGVETFRYILLHSGFRISSADVRVEVIGDNTAPVARDDAYSAVQDMVLEVAAANGVLANDVDVDGDTLRASLIEGPLNGILDLESSGAFSYRPFPGFLGEDSFRYVADDGLAVSGPAVVTITVNPETQPPVVEDIPDQTGSVGMPFELDLSVYVTDPDTPGESLRFEALALPAGLNLSPDGLISGFPTIEAVGTTVARFTVDDGEHLVEGQFNLTIRDDRVTDISLALTAGPNPLVLGETATWSITVVNQSNYNVDGLTVTGRFTGEVPFLFDTANDGACMLTPAGDETELSCTLGALVADQSETIELTGTANQMGDVVAILSAAAAAGPPDVDPADNGAAMALSVAEGISDVPAQELPGFEALSLAAGDLDGDGHDDLAVATAQSESVLVFLNVEDPEDARKRLFASAPLRIGAAARDHDIALADLDGDSDLDIVAAGSASAFPRVYLNDGLAGFETVTLDQVAHEATALTIHDIDGDGFADLALAGEVENLVYLGTGVPGEYAAPLGVGGSPGRDLAAADLFSDGRADLILANIDGDASIYSLVGSTFELSASLPTGSTTSVAADDFNGDGAIDLMFGRTLVGGASPWPSNPLYLNDPSAEAKFAPASDLGAAPTISVVAADADASGNADAVVLNETGAHQVFLNSGGGQGTFVLASNQLSVPEAAGATLGRFSVDGRIDLAIGGMTGVKVFWSDGSGDFGVGDVTAPTITLAGSATVEILAGNAFNDPGATAMDTDDGDLTDQIVVTNPVDPDVIGSYTVTYEVWDSSGNAAAMRTRSVEVNPREPAGGGGGGALGLVSIVALWLAFVTVGRGPAVPAKRRGLNDANLT